MRKTFIRTLMEIAAEHPEIWLLCGDLGFSVLEDFAHQYADRYVNMGVAEQNMMGVAAGLALSGKTVVVYSIANFPTLRCLEQIRNDVCYHNLNVKIVAVGGGVGYGTAGYTHHGVEDIAAMRVLPNIRVLCPGDLAEAEWAVRTALAQTGPFYVRLGKDSQRRIHPEALLMELGRPVCMRRGGDLTFFVSGGTLPDVIESADQLGKLGLQAAVYSVPTLHPLDPLTVLDIARQSRLMFSIEEHGVGGLGTILAEILADGGIPVRLVRKFLRNTELTAAGSREYLLQRQGLDVESICETAISIVRNAANGRSAGDKTE